MTRSYTGSFQAHRVHLIYNARIRLRAVGRVFRTTLHVLQTAQAMRALSSLNDRQLAEIGIKRRDIPNYAERLMSPGRSFDEEKG